MRLEGNAIMVNPNWPSQNREVIIIEQNQSVIKGIIWGVLGFKLGAAGLTSAGYTLVTSPLIATPLAFVPVVGAVASGILLSGACSCISNAAYHILPQSNDRVVILRG